MQISTLPGLYPPPINPGQTRSRPVEELSGVRNSDGAFERDTSQTSAATGQQQLVKNQSAVRISLLDSNIVDVVRRGRGRIDSTQNSAVQRALTEYTTVSSQEQRLEYAEVFGLDVYV